MTFQPFHALTFLIAKQSFNTGMTMTIMSWRMRELSAMNEAGKEEDEARVGCVCVCVCVRQFWQLVFPNWRPLPTMFHSCHKVARQIKREQKAQDTPKTHPSTGCCWRSPPKYFQSEDASELQFQIRHLLSPFTLPGQRQQRQQQR